MNRRYILFDLDGTLTDPKVGITRSVQHALHTYGIEEPDPDRLTPFIGPPLVDSFAKYYGFPREQGLEAIERYREYFSVKGLFENEVYPGIPEMLADLKARGKVLLVATSKAEKFARQILEHFDLAQYFDFICGATMDVTIRSAKADVIAYALEQAGVTDKVQAVMVGDRLHDVEGARACGLDCVGVLFGYGSREELEEAGAAAIAETVGDLHTMLKGDDPMPESMTIFFPCKDLEETIRYYTEVVGLTVHSRQEAGSVWFDTGAGYLAFCDYGPGRAMATGECISFNLNSREAVDARYALLRQTPGVLGLDKPPAHHPRFPVYSFFFRDPNGYLLEFQKVD